MILICEDKECSASGKIVAKTYQRRDEKWTTVDYRGKVLGRPSTMTYYTCSMCRHLATVIDEEGD